MKPSRFLTALAVAGLLLLGTLLRTWRITFPLADWHSWRQADTAAVARNFVQDEFNLLYPQSDSLLALNDKGLDNPHRWFLNEFPFYNAFVALLYRQFGIHEYLGRAVSIAFAMTGALFLYLLTAKLLGKRLALLALLFYVTSPYNIYYGRVFMPDPTFVALSIISLYWAVRFAKSQSLAHGLLLAGSFALATLVKPYALFMAIPIAYWLLVSWGRPALKNRRLVVLALVSLLPLVLWRLHLFLHPEGSFASKWLLNADGIRFTGSFFRWIIFDRFNRLIFATGGFALFVVGLFHSHTTRARSLFFVWALSVFLYITIFAKGNVNHDYYQLPIVAPGVVLAVIGASELIKLGKTRLSKWLNGSIALGLFVLSIAFGWYEVRDFFKVNNPAIVEAGQKIDEITPVDALVIAPYFGDQAFLYQTNRSGWPVGGNIEERIRDGATHYVTTSRDQEYNELKTKYTLIFENDRFSILQLVVSGVEP